MFLLHVPCHKSIQHLLPVLPALHPSLLTLPVGRSLSHHPSPVRRLWLVTYRLAWAADHADCLPDISPQAHPIGQADQGTKCTLDQILVPTMWPCHQPCRRGNSGAYPLFHSHPALLRPPPPPSPSASPPHPPPHWIWWDIAVIPASLLKLP